MTSASPLTAEVALRAYGLAARAIPLIAPTLLRRRLKRGKEDAARWCEKLGEPTADRPQGTLIWLHAVGLGEVLALRGLITALADIDPDLNFLVTSTARSSSQVMGSNLPPRTTHQFLPLDAPQYLSKFLTHWRPDLSIWSEQDLWPNAIAMTDRTGIPVALVNARMNAASLSKRRFGRALYQAAFARMSLIAAQEAQTAANLESLGAQNVRVTGSLKSAAPALTCDATELAKLQSQCAGRKPWVLASSHAGDEAAAIAAQSTLLKDDPSQLLILAPRDANRAKDAGEAVDKAGLSAITRSIGGPITAQTQVYIADTYGELGLWYRLCDRALIGGSFGGLGGHNPWEAAALDCAILHGPDTANFAADYEALGNDNAAIKTSAETLTDDLRRPDLATIASNARALSDTARTSLAPLAQDLHAQLR